MKEDDMGEACSTHGRDGGKETTWET